MFFKRYKNLSVLSIGNNSSHYNVINIIDYRSIHTLHDIDYKYKSTNALIHHFNNYKKLSYLKPLIMVNPYLSQYLVYLMLLQFVNLCLFPIHFLDQKRYLNHPKYHPLKIFLINFLYFVGFRLYIEIR